MSTTDPQRSEIWYANLPSKGSEINKPRPVVVVSLDEIGTMPLRIVVPLTDWKEDKHSNFPWFTKVVSNGINKLDKTSGADGFQVKSITCGRFISKIGRVSAEDLEYIIKTIMLCIGAD